MKLYILSCAILLLMAGITLAGNSLKVTGQSDLDILMNASNAAANATADAMEKAIDVLSSAPNATSQSQEGLQKYENPKLGISFTYPSEWGEPMEPPEDCQTDNRCVVDFMNFTPSGILTRAVGSVTLNKSTSEDPACNCNSLKDYVVWEYNRLIRHTVFVNDNETTIHNQSAWQIEARDKDGNGKKYYLLITKDGVGYRFMYFAPSDLYAIYLDDFKNMINSIKFTPPVPEKKPSFLNSSEIANTSILPSTSTTHDKSIKILSSNDFIDYIGYLHVVGEIENNTPANIQFVKVTGTFYDSNNQVVATDFTYTNPREIGSGQKAPFELTLLSASIPVTQIDHYNLIASYD